MTDKPTTAECIAAQSTASMRDQSEIFNAVCAQLLAAQEMAKALEATKSQYCIGTPTRTNADVALTAWREAGGQ